MKRVLVRTFISMILCTAAVLSVDAQQGRRRPARSAQAPQSSQIGTAMGDVRWGMTKQELLTYFRNRLMSQYQPQINKAPGAIEEDRLRQELQQKIQTIENSYVRFDGNTTGWDVSFLRPEYTHHNNEAMLVVRDPRAQNFYFFINDRLWKWYRAFNAAEFAGYSFDQFAEALQGRYGRALRREGQLREAGENQHWLEWQDATSRLRAIDETRFYGFYCLVFEEKATLAQLDTLRRNREPQTAQRSNTSLVDAVTSDDEESVDRHADIVDRITGQIRNRQQAPEGTTTQRGNDRATPPPQRSTESSPSRGGALDDPLGGF